MPPLVRGGGKTVGFDEGVVAKMNAYNKNNLSLAKLLRKNMTSQERKLWFLFLRNYPVKFYRQRPVDNFILDFYCAKAKLAIELDGSGHYEPVQIEKDTERTAKLKHYGIDVLRISNLDIDNNFKAVCDYIDIVVNRKKTTPQSADLAADSSPNNGSRELGQPI